MTLRLLVILPTIGKSGGGVSEVARLYVSHWAQRQDTAIEVVALETPDTAQALADWPDVPIHVFPSIGPARFGASPAMLRFLLQHDYDVAHVHGIWMFHVYAALRWAYRFRRPYMVTPHGMLEPWILQRSPLLKWGVSVLFQNRFLRRADCIHALNAKEAGDILALVQNADILEVPNFVPPVALPEGQPAWWQPSFADRRVVLFLGRIHDKKGWRELLQAWEGACAADVGFGPRHQLVFCGWIDEADAFSDEVARLAAEHGNVIFAGPQHGAEKFRSYAAADLFILPSKSEGLPMTVLEAWATGCPVMMTEACNLPLGFAAKAALRIGETAPEVQSALLALQQITPEEFDTLRQNARTLRSTHYSPEACGTALWNSLNQIAAQKRRV